MHPKADTRRAILSFVYRFGICRGKWNRPGRTAFRWSYRTNRTASPNAKGQPVPKASVNCEKSVRGTWLCRSGSGKNGESCHLATGPMHPKADTVRGILSLEYRHGICRGKWNCPGRTAFRWSYRTNRSTSPNVEGLSHLPGGEASNVG